jgi:DNA-directed DNA polymerase III PolC
LTTAIPLFTHLHTHSCYSFLEGLPFPADLARAAAGYEMPALALTDHLSLTGALVFYRACQEAGVKPILGLEIDLLLPFRLSHAPAPAISGVLVLLAIDLAGWNNLCRISSLLLTGPEDTLPLCRLETLAEHSTGLVCLTGGCRGAVQRLLDHPEGVAEAGGLLEHLSDIFPGRLYVELNQQFPSDPASNRRLAGLARNARLPLVAAQDIYYLQPGQAALQRTLAAIRTLTPLARLPANPISAATNHPCAPDQAYFCSPAEMQAAYSEFPEALACTEEIAARCNLDLRLNQPHYPRVPLPPGLTAAELLRHKAAAGARRLYAEIPAEVTRRLDAEIDVITARGYETIFLIAEEMLSFARESGVPSASRGSASSSLVAHCLGITTPDPLTLDLYFERFLNPARATPPDIDTDFCSRRRDDVINHLFETYGPDRVAMVGTVNTFRPRSALSETAKAHGFKPPEIHGLLKRIGHRFWGSHADTRPPFAELVAQYGSNPRYARLFREAEALLGLPHHLSVHPGGVVIAPGPMVDFVPVARSGGKGVTITQFDLEDVQRAGLVKLDLLGIRGLTVLGDVAESIHSWRRKEFPNPMEVLETIPADDPETSALVAAGRTIGCFQIESPGMRATLKEIQARSISDLMAALALYRPGPLKGGLRDAFVRRYKRQEPVTHIHPSLSGLLRETYGVILYQEQVLRIAHDLAGLSLAEGDLLRRAMSHFDPGKQMQVLMEKFIAGAQARSNIPPETGARVWEMMAAFAGYGFPKAHAASYAQVAWRSAWCKAHYPAEFIAAVLANWGGYYPQSVYLSEARRLGFSVRPPHINRSHRQFAVAYPNGEPVLYMGLDQVRDLTHRTQERILRYRHFDSLAEFILSVDPRLQEVENLIQVGAFDGIGAIPDLLNELAAGRPRPGQLTLFRLSEPSGEDWSLDQKISAQQRLLGIGLEAHPLEQFAGQLRAAQAITTLEAAAKMGETVRVAGLRQTMHRNITADGEWMGFLSLEDLEGILDVILFPDIYRRARSALSSPSSPLVIEGVVVRDENTGEPALRAEKIWRLK